MNLKLNEQLAARYVAQVTRTSLAIELEPELQLIAEQQARASHEGWMKGKMAKGYVWGTKRNDDSSKGQLTHPLLVPYDELDDATKQANVANAVAVLKILREKEVLFVSFTKAILYPIARQIHDEWSRQKINDGWVWGPVTDETRKVHRDLVPFEILAADPNLRADIAYDVDTARQIMLKMMTENDVFPVIHNLAKFKLEGAMA